ncbi:ABC transporter permease [Lachnospiraceae bacterium KGMB03038]|nr:ABC transporter permease [Lachnospiraceae bacterium KGMB03038]
MGVSTKKAQTKKKSPGQIIQKLFLSEYFILYLTILCFVCVIPFVPKIITQSNLLNVMSNLWPLLVVAVGQTFVLLLGGIDLSQVSIIGVTSVMGTVLISDSFNEGTFASTPLWGWLIGADGGPLAGSAMAIPVCILVMLLVGTLIGLFNGYFVAEFKMPPFMVTLVTQMFFLNFAIFLTQSRNVMGLPEGFKEIGKGSLGGIIPYAAILTVTVTVIGWFILAKLVLGKWIYATGANITASVVSGVPTKKVTVFCYAFSGFCAAAGSVIYSARLNMGRPTLGEDLTMDIVGAAVLGGTSLLGGKGKVTWTVFGVLFYTILFNVLNLFNLSYYTINIVKGCVILVAAFLDVVRTKLAVKISSENEAGV